MRTLLLALLVLAVNFAPAYADYINLPVKWSQVQWDPNGTDWLSDCTSYGVMADDFICDSEDPIVAIRWWGSYQQTTPRADGFTGPFDISFHLSVNEQHPFSLPGPLVYFSQVPAQEAFVGVDNQGIPVYRYDAYIPPFEQWLYSQLSPNKGELFLDICKPTGELWGWHEVVPPHPILDFAAFSPTHGGPWFTTGTTDMAFELMTVPEPVSTTLFLLGGATLAVRRLRRKG